MTLLWNIVILSLATLSVGWVLWRWLKASDEPIALIVRWILSALVMGFVLLNAARAKDEFSKIAAVLIGAVGGLIMTFIWRQKFCDFVADKFASLYTGGGEPAEPTPFYSIANAKRKRGQYAEAIAEVRNQLAMFPTDFAGWMLLAEIQAEDMKDLPAAQATLDQLLSQEGHAPKNIAYALTREADWHLKYKNDPEGARAALERITLLLPDTEQAQIAMQRIARLAPAEFLAERQSARTVALPQGVDNVGLRTEPLDLKPKEEDPAETAGKYVRQLEAFPNDSDTREKLALLYARHYQRLDLAADQLEQLISFPNQPAKQVVHWLNMLADLHIELASDPAQARLSLQRIIDLYPKTAAAGNASNRIAHLKLELRPKQKSQVVKLGSYEQNLGLKRSDPSE